MRKVHCWPTGTLVLYLLCCNVQRLRIRHFLSHSSNQHFNLFSMDLQENLQVGKELKSISLEDKSFVANGKTYYIERSVSADRYKEYLKLEAEFSFGSSAVDIFNSLSLAFDALDSVPLMEMTLKHITDAKVILHNTISAVALIADRELEVMKICALFINQKDEDRRFYDEKVVTEKINDWNQEGFDVSCFFGLAVSFSGSLRPIYEASSQIILNRENRQA